MDKEQKAIQRLKQAAKLSEFYYQKPLLLAYSGGKDSEVCLELLKRSGVRFEVSHNHTTADAPETVRHIRKKFPELELAGVPCTINYPTYKGQPTSMWQLIPQKLMPPTRVARYCCQVFKEGNGKNRCLVLGIRSSESVGRSDAGVAELNGKIKADRTVFDFDNGDERIIAPCQMKAMIKIHPILDFTTRDIWDFLRDSKTEINPVYDMGLTRCGCVGCPMAGKGRYTEFRLWPKYEQMYRRAFERMLDMKKARGKETLWKTADDVWRWWLEDKNLDGQLSFDGGEIGKEMEE